MVDFKFSALTYYTEGVLSVLGERPYYNGNLSKMYITKKLLDGYTR